MPVAGFRLAAR